MEEYKEFFKRYNDYYFKTHFYGNNELIYLEKLYQMFKARFEAELKAGIKPKDKICETEDDHEIGFGERTCRNCGEYLSND